RTKIGKLSGDRQSAGRRAYIRVYRQQTLISKDIAWAHRNDQRNARRAGDNLASRAVDQSHATVADTACTLNRNVVSEHFRSVDSLDDVVGTAGHDDRARGGGGGDQG